MLAGLIIATHDAADRPGMLTATLPFGGVTLIEYQARLLVAAGASQLVVMVARLTPELLGAIGRIGRRGVTVDTVRSAAEAAERLHPLARVLMLADGLTTTPDVVAGMAREGGDALLVIDESDHGSGYERVGGGMAWAGVARLDPRRIGELAALPRDYDTESTLVRLASQARAVHVVIGEDALRRGHGIDHRAATLVDRGRSVLTAAVSTRRTWFDRLVIAPLARLVIPLLVPRAIPVIAVAGVTGAIGLGGLAALWFGHVAPGLILALVATIIAAIAAMLASLRDETAMQRMLALAGLAVPALALLLAGRGEAVVAGNAAPLVVAIAAVVAGGLAERAAAGRNRGWWWGSPPAYLAVAMGGALLGLATLGLALAAALATATLAAIVELFRAQP